MLTPFPVWMKEKPLVDAVALELPPPSLNDNTADLDRLSRALRQRGYDPLFFHPEAIRNQIKKIRQNNFRVTAIVAYNGNHWECVRVMPFCEDAPVLAFAVDLGTSQLAFYLLDLGKRKILDRMSVRNPQIPYGEDILTRILLAREEENLMMLQELLVKAFNETIREMLERRGCSPEDVYALSVAGNTSMSHLFLGLDPTNICKEPYIPAANHFPCCHGRDLDLAVHPNALVITFPNVGSYFGGDLIAGILYAGLHRTDEVSIFVDVGTNAEVVLGNKDWLIACAGAAGPALEGGVVERGMMASPGAIDRVRINPDTLEPTYHVLGEKKPVGICGSGLIDLVAEMFQAGVLTIHGKINEKLKSSRIVQTEHSPAYIVAFGNETADGKDLMVSEIDIGIFLKSKAAMYTILTVITNKVGISFSDLKHFYVAGTFGNYIDPAMAIRIGMIPDLPLEIYQGLGNTAGHGAAMLLLDRDLLQDIEKICDQITYIELNVNMELMNEFRGATFIPHTDPKLFPSVQIPERALG